jgi:molybdenum cofactor sulfurtransferase
MSVQTEAACSAAENHLSTPDDAYFEELRNREFAILDQQGHSYLDFTGGGLYPAGIVRRHHDQLLSHILGNPHSTNPTSQLATNLVEDTRNKVLNFFNAKDYICVFTQNASGALKVVGESYPFGPTSTLVLLADNHNSVNGIREYCNQKGGKTRYVQVQYEDLQMNEDLLMSTLAGAPVSEAKLFAFPAQSNVSGVKHDLKWIDIARKNGFDVLLDAAAFVPSNRLDLCRVRPDFVSVSFYKIFGYPTGIGCLLIHKDAFAKLTKPWFAGGTVTLVSVVEQNRFLADGHERFEDGTLSYNMLPAIGIGLDFMNEVGIDRISARVRRLIEYLCTGLKGLTHTNGRRIVKVFGPQNFDQRGGNIILNFFDSAGEVIPFEKIEALTNARKISIRSGCFCNPGIDEINNCITTDEISKYFMSRDKGDYYDMIAFLGKMRGATRVSVGMATSKKDLDNFIDFVASLANQAV